MVILLLIHALIQGEVREFASGVVHDALKIAVTLHHGAFDPSTVQSLAIWCQQQLSITFPVTAYCKQVVTDSNSCAAPLCAAPLCAA